MIATSCPGGAKVAGVCEGGHFLWLKVENLETKGEA